MLYKFLVPFLLLAACTQASKPAVEPIPEEPQIYPAVAAMAIHDHDCVDFQNLEHLKTCLAQELGAGSPTGGTAFWISKHVIATAQHVGVYAPYEPKGYLVQHIDGRLYTKVYVDQWYFPDYIDVAFGYVANPPLHDTLPICDTVYETEEAYIAGHPKAKPTVSNAHPTGTAGGFLFFNTDYIAPGFSGGPIVSKARKCALGVVFARASKTRGIAISADILRDLLKAVNDFTSIPTESR